MKQFLEFISLHVPTIIIAIINLFIMYAILKRFLFKPVTNMIAQRENEVKQAYAEAEKELSSGRQASELYQSKLSEIDKERDALIVAAIEDANKQSEKIVQSGKNEVLRLKQDTAADIEKSKQLAVREAKQEIGDISVSIASAILDREVSKNDNQKIISDFLEQIEVAK